jgi:hypothetical protein
MILREGEEFGRSGSVAIAGDGDVVVRFVDCASHNWGEEEEVVVQEHQTNQDDDKYLLGFALALFDIHYYN